MKVLIVVDMQNDFITGALGTPEAEKIVPIIREKIDQADEDTFIVFTRDTHDRNYLFTQEGKYLPVEHCIEGSFGWQIQNSLMITAGSHEYETFDKPTFGGLDMAYFLYDTVQSEGVIDSIELCGVCTGICVISNAFLLKAHMPEVPIIVDAAACACITPESHLRALESMKTCQIEVINE